MTVVSDDAPVAGAEDGEGTGLDELDPRLVDGATVGSPSLFSPNNCVGFCVWISSLGLLVGATVGSGLLFSL